MNLKEKLLQFAENLETLGYAASEKALAEVFPNHRTRVTIDRDTRAMRLSVDDFTVEIPRLK